MQKRIFKIKAYLSDKDLKYHEIRTSGTTTEEAFTNLSFLMETKWGINIHPAKSVIEFYDELAKYTNLCPHVEINCQWSR